MRAGLQKILREIGSEPVSGFYLRPGLEVMRVGLETHPAGVSGEQMTASYPSPSVSSREGREPVAWPRPVTLLLREAEKHGWQATWAWARGCMPHATTGRPGEERDSYSVRFRRGEWQGYAIYGGGATKSWQSIMVTGRSLPPFGKLGRTELSAWLAEPQRPATWYDEIRARVAAKEAAAKERARERKPAGRGEAL